MIQLNDFQRQWDLVKHKAIEALSTVGESGWLILGNEVSALESELSRYFGGYYAVGCGNGMDALEIGLRCLDLNPGDKVLTTPLSAFASSLAILRSGGTPVFIDVDQSGLMNLELARKTLEQHREIKFILPVHLYGHAIDLDKYSELIEEFNLRSVEDCAQAFGAKSDVKPVGTASQIAATSFYPTKNLGAMGDGGALFCATEELAHKARALRNYGETEKYQHRHSGLNSRLDELQAAILRRALLPHIYDFISKRREIASCYIDGIKNRAITILDKPARSQSSWHLFPIRVRDRHLFASHMTANGIATGIHYPTLITEQKALQSSNFEIVGRLDVAKAITEEVVSLPIHPFLTSEEIKKVIETCNKWE